MCAEALPWRCHRSLIADALTARGVSVAHIMGAAQAAAARDDALRPGGGDAGHLSSARPLTIGPANPVWNDFRS